jgi:hypothetical protein
MRSRSLRLSIVAVVVALMAIVIAAPAGANNYTRGNDFDLSVTNDSATAVTASVCLNGHVSFHYQFGTTHDPCLVTPIVHPYLEGHGGHWKGLKANPMGIIVRAPGHKTLYFYAYNPSVGKPFLEVNGHRYALVEGEVKVIPVDGSLVAFHRGGDRDGHKVILVQIKQIAKG